MRRPIALAALACAGLLGVTACAPGSEPVQPDPAQTPAQDVQTDAAQLGDVTLTVWDQEVRGGQAAQIEALNAAFEEEYPNITLERVTRSYDDLNQTLGLALSGDDPPDVFQANNGKADMGAYVRAGQLVPLDRYAEAYGWSDRYPESVRQYSSYTPDGATFGEGSLYGLPQVGEVVGLYINTDHLTEAGLEPPTSWEEFQSALETMRQQRPDEAPLVLGNLDQWPAIHVFGPVQAQHVAPDDIRALGFGQQGATWTTPENTEAAQTLVDWMDAGILDSNVNGQGYDPAWQAFGQGTGTFLMAGTWLAPDLAGMGDAVTFVLPPPSQAAGGTVVSTGGTGIPWAISSQSENPDAAAAYIDFITDEDAMGVLAENGNLPIVEAGDQDAPDQLTQDVFDAFGTVVEEDGLVPYLDYATPTMYDTIGQALQDLLAQQQSPDQFLETLQTDLDGYLQDQN